MIHDVDSANNSLMCIQSANIMVIRATDRDRNQDASASILASHATWSWELINYRKLDVIGSF